TPVDHDADESMIQAQAIMVTIATGEPGTMGKMVPNIATSMRMAAMIVTMTSTVAVYSSEPSVVRALFFNGRIGPHKVIGAVVGAHSEEAAVVVPVFGVGFESARAQNTHIRAGKHVVCAVAIAATRGVWSCVEGRLGFGGQLPLVHVTRGYRASWLRVGDSLGIQQARYRCGVCRTVSVWISFEGARDEELRAFF